LCSERVGQVGNLPPIENRPFASLPEQTDFQSAADYQLDYQSALHTSKPQTCTSAAIGGGVEPKKHGKEYIELREGNYYVAGTRLSLDSIVHAFRRGESPESVCQNFELLRLEEVYGAVAYYLANQTEIDAYLIRQGEKWAEGKRSAEPLPANLRERLMRARE